MPVIQYRLEAYITAIDASLNLPCKLFASDGPDKVMKKVDDEFLVNLRTNDRVCITAVKTTPKVLLDPEQLSLDDAKHYLASGYVWGKVKAVHVIGDYQIVEYHPRNCGRGNRGIDYETTHFHPYIDWIDTNRSYTTLEEAMVGMVAYRFDGNNSQAAMYFSRMIGLKGTYEE